MQYINNWSISLVKEGSIGVQTKRINSPEDLSNILTPLLSNKPKEHFVVLTLSTKNEVTGYNVVSVGTVNTTIVHPRDVFQPALLANATSIVIAHNHPSGDVTPSDEDYNVTNRLVEAGGILGIEVLDHLIITNDNYFSFKRQGLI